MDIFCDNCQKPIGTKEEPGYRVQKGHIDDSSGKLVIDANVGFYCADCVCIAGGQKKKKKEKG